MKKLMIAAAVALAAVVSQAASISWIQAAAQLGIAADTVTAGLAANTHYDASTTNAKGQITPTTVLITLTYGTEGEEGYWTESQSVSYSWNNTKKGTASNIEFTKLVLTTATTTLKASYTMSGKITDGKGETWDVVSDTVSETINLSSASTKWTAKTSAGWSTTPEPTSGLLLLVGMAGLALRRRRA